MSASRPVCRHKSCSQSTQLQRRRRALAALPAALFLATASAWLAHNARADTVTWNVGSGTWTDGVGAANWNPADEPDPVDSVIIGTPVTVTMGSSNEIQSLDMFNNASLETNGFNLTINGSTTLNGGVTGITIAAGSAVSAQDIVLGPGSGSQLVIRGGTLSLIEIGAGLATLVNVHGTITGFGAINLNDAPAAPTTLFENNATLTANSAFGIILGAPPAGTLQINAPSANARINLDGFSESGIVNVNRNQTLDINGTLSDAFSGTMNLFHNSTIDISTPWTIDAGGKLNVSNGASGVFPFNVPADVAYVSGPGLTLSNGTITVATADSTLQFNAPFTLSSGTFVNNGHVIFNANATVSSASGFTMPTSSSSLTVNPGVSVTINTPNFNADGSDAATNVLTVNSGGSLTLHMDVGGADESLTGTINLSGGALTVTTIDNDWVINRALNVAASSGTSTVGGENLTVQNTALSVGANSALNFTTSSTTFASGNAVTVNAGALLNVASAANFTSAGAITGAGAFRTNAATNFTGGTTTISTATFDWDGTTTGQFHTINNAATLNINSPAFDTDGDMDENIVLGGNSATLTVSGPASWELRATLTANAAQLGSAFIGGTSRLVLPAATGALSIQGNTTISAPLTLGPSSVTTVFNNAILSATNAAFGVTYDGGTITGAGYYKPASLNNVTASSVISTSKFYFSLGNWTVQSGATLTINVADYDPEFSPAVKSFDSTITLNSGSLSVLSGLPAFIVNGSLNMNNTTGVVPNLNGQLAQFGNDIGPPNANLAVGGTGVSTISPQTNFKSDANVTVGPSATLVLLDHATFEPVNGANNANFSGAGTFILESSATFAETTTLNFAGGTVDLDGRNSDLIGNTLAVNAPLTINAAIMNPFGKLNFLFNNIITVDRLNPGRTGSLAVNLDNPAAEWTLNPQGALTLLNSNSPATLLSGNALNVNGTLTVTGDVRTTARLDIGGLAIVNINSVGEPLRLAGGSLADPNTIAGAIVNGPGILGADDARMLRGVGTISAFIDFDGSAELRAAGGTLTVAGIAGSLLDVGIIGTANATGVLAFTNPQTLAADMTLELLGGSVTGAALTNQGLIRGSGIVANNVTNTATGTLRPAVASTLRFTGAIGSSAGFIFLNSGTAQFDNALTNAGFIFGPGTLDANLGVLNVGAIQAIGATTVFGPITSLGGSSIVIDPAATATFHSNVILEAGATLAAGAGSTNFFRGFLTVNGGAVTLASNVAGTSIATLFINPGGSFDASNNRLIIDYDFVSPADAIRQYISNGRLFSSTASADPDNRLTIGYAEASLLGVTSWSGIEFNGAALLTRMTWFGDATLDGKIDFDDFVRIDLGFAKGLTGWVNGDFNHSGSVTLEDYLLIDRVYHQQGVPLSPAFLSMRESQFGPAYVSALLTSIPEPSLLFALAGLPLIARRRRRRPTDQ